MASAPVHSVNVQPFFVNEPFQHALLLTPRQHNANKTWAIHERCVMITPDRTQLDDKEAAVARRGFLSALIVIGLLLGAVWPKSADPGIFADAVGEYALENTIFDPGPFFQVFWDAWTFWDDEGTEEERRKLVEEYFALRNEQRDLDRLIERNEADAADIARRNEITDDLDNQRNRVEQIIEDQVSWAVFELGIRKHSMMPPMEIQFRENPLLLVISDRDKINSVGRIRVIDNMTLEEKETLEARVEAMGYSAYVFNLGGQSTYPSTVLPCGIRCTLRVTAHEWVHHFRSMHNPIGKVTDSQSRAIEETIADMMDDVIADAAYRRFYDPDYQSPEQSSRSATPEQTDPDAFDYTAEMRETYERTVALLEAGRIDEAEAYMNARRDFFEENGRYVRKINQAYFAFKGSYATNPAFSGGQDGVGEKLRRIWNHLDDPRRFIEIMRNVTNMEELEAALTELGLK